MTTKASQSAIRPRVSVDQWGIFSKGEITPTGFSYSRQLNAPPSASLSYSIVTQDAKNSAIRTSASSILPMLGKQQTSVFEGKTHADASVGVTITDSDYYQFHGFACGDSFGVQAESITSSGTAAIAWTEMEALNYSIYAPDPKNTKVFSSGVKGNNFLEIIKSVEEKLFKAWSDDTYEAKKALNKHQAELDKKVHARNEKLRDYFLRILDASTDTIGWTRINTYLAADTVDVGDNGAKLPGQSLRESIAELVCGILQNGGGSFFGQVLQIGELFQWIFVPSDSHSHPGKYVNKAYAVGGSPEDLTVEAINFSGKTSNIFGLLPVSHVYIKPPAPKDTQRFAKAVGVCAPKEAAEKGGTQIEAPSPRWWFPATSSGDAAIIMKVLAESAPEGEFKAMGPDLYQDASGNKDATAAQIPMEFDIGYMWAMLTYAWGALAASTAAIAVPGTFNIEPGKRYKVKSAKGEELFTGFLTGFSTSVSTSSCLTNLVFSHIMFPGFKLPGEEELKAAGIISS